MNLVPFRRRQADRAITRFEDAFAGLIDRFFEPDWLGLNRDWAPPVDVTESDDAIVVKAELPGMKTEDIELSVQGNMLTISGQKREEFEDKRDSFHRVERRYGSFRRDIPLPAEVTGDKVEATYRDGVLTVTMPKAEQAKSKRIQVKAQ
jgi:HSP20 family protein